MHPIQTDPLLSILSSACVPLVCVISLLAFGVFLVTGYSMKFSLAVAGVGRFGFWKSIGISCATTTAVCLVSCLMAVAMYLLEGESVVVGLISAFLSVTAFAVVVAMMGRCGIVRGYATYFLNGFFAVIGFVGLATLMVPVVMVASPMMQIDPEDLGSLRQAFRQDRMPPLGFSPEATPMSLDSLRSISLIEDEIDDGESDLESLPEKWHPVQSSDASVQDVFYQPSLVETPPRDDNPTASPSRGIQANPFVQ